jgi:hypothetical protein
MEEACIDKHFPNDWISPIIWLLLWEYFNPEIIVSGL